VNRGRRAWRAIIHGIGPALDGRRAHAVRPDEAGS